MAVCTNMLCVHVHTAVFLIPDDTSSGVPYWRVHSSTRTSAAARSFNNGPAASHHSWARSRSTTKFSTRVVHVLNLNLVQHTIRICVGY